MSTTFQFALHGLELPVRIRPGRPMTDDELLQFCADNELLNIEREPDGELLVMTPTFSGTGRKNAWIIQQLANWADRQGEGLAFDSNTGFTLPDGSMRSPDGSWLSRLRWDALTPAEQDAFAPVCPEFVMELRSKSDRLSDLQQKMHAWIANGAQLAWLLDPERRVVEIYRPGQEPLSLADATEVHGEGLVTGFVLPLERVWL